ncbi:Kef-type K+ transport system membrane component KefB/nucleotide-binding universal stress UspA family protein [Bradyrhizobium sp. USDA 4524]|uniref:cation:proton antiporter domain-containing protein n=1 Tax=unclassified Bradyrhizobium TaxID=2631580 RepID=UPI00209F6561|nr:MULTISPECIES: cation:proton antiporter [unclassified Bradyrhizobium]MCP1843895.1 Kef-type K+ transport system membrane component KefB/nucleotide-binding universal stress UspA family protein [Bradyrhizobium sp. USDA 4538]MCP1904461.1 Kef-type K+ transport system membrane component KefB/nucleotide-binding universal stress UspA family protein [Bradyrhizobium sp. USDA 4537]MCP1989883.1 Kef-type K+ transport system membrane component KefB/nucleotide-binding universal stress UspA family protein [Br
MVIRWGRLQPAIWATVILLVSITAADAAGDKASKPSEFILLVQIALLIAVGRGLGELMQRIGQPSVVGELLGGLLLGPSLFGWLWPSAHGVIFPPSGEQKALIDGIAQFGILLLLLLTGMDTDLKLVRKVGRAATTISVAGIAVPFVCGFVLAEFLPDGLLPHPEARLIASLFLGTALSISSVKIVAVVVREMNFMRRNVGQIIVASAIIDDTLGWIIIAVIFSLASRGSLDILSVAQALFGTLAFLAVSFTIGRRLVFRLIRWANDNLVSSAAVITVILLLMCGMAMITHLIGVHTVLGAFIAGVLVGESPILTRQIDERLRGLISSLFMPVFFGLAGLSADLTVLKDPSVLGLTAALVLIASIGKFGGAFAGGALGGLTRQESYALASGMNARGSTEVIIATIGLSMGVLSQTMFSMIVTMAILTTMAMPPMLRSALARLPLGQDEKDRLEREEYEQRGFVANLERLLVAVDESSNATFAAHLAGQLAGGRGLPITVLHVGANAKLQEKNRADEESPEAAVINAAKASAEADADGGGNVDVISRAREETAAEAIAEEAKKGFDLLVVGMDAVAGPDGGFDRRLDDLTSGFDGPLAIAAAKGVHEKEPTANARKILVPVSGSNVSRRGAEVAIALARLSSEPLQVVYVSTTRDKGARRTSPSMSLAHEEAILKDIAATAARYDINVTTRLRANTAPEVAILQEIASSRADLVVIGVDRIQGDSLNFGSVAAAVLGKSKASVLLVSDGDVRPKT